MQFGGFFFHRTQSPVKENKKLLQNGQQSQKFLSETFRPFRSSFPALYALFTLLISDFPKLIRLCKTVRCHLAHCSQPSAVDGCHCLQWHSALNSRRITVSLQPGFLHIPLWKCPLCSAPDRNYCGQPSPSGSSI